METVNATIPDFRTTEPGMAGGNGAELEDFKHRVDDIFTKVDKLEQRVNEVEQFYLTTSKKQPNNSKASSIAKEKDKEKRIPSIKKLQQEAAHREAAAAKRMQELMRQFGTILRQITQHKWAWPFMQPVDVEGLGLHDYYEVIDRPMDFSTIKNQMEAKDGTGYKNVRDICADVRLVFTNAMKYNNDEKSDVHVMAKTLLAKFEEKWLQLLPKVTEEEKRREEEEAQVEINMKLAQEAAHAKMARDLSNEIYEVDMHLEELREMLVQNCRLIIWDGGHNGIQVHFTDIKDLVQQNSIHGNVIDAYAAMLTEMHKTVSGRSEYVGTSYIYTSVCSDMMRNSSAVSRAKYLNVHMKAARGCRYTLFPIYNANHWTVMAHDSESGNWKHYNSMRPRRGVRDEHYNEALKVKQWMSDHHNQYVKPRVTAAGVRADLFDGTFVSVVDCPQQVPESSDCGIFVCFIIRQYIRGAEVNTTMDGLTPTGLRAAMVDMFLSDPGRGLRARTL